jgi:hypothetical protein
MEICLNLSGEVPPHLGAELPVIHPISIWNISNQMIGSMSPILESSSVESEASPGTLAVRNGLFAPYNTQKAVDNARDISR